ncbi:hypothetical protein Cycma_4618 [Cyclobacterium marinum DSM 745]|uniref:Uncharacterized protein n=1 Tax=Cyclobacterium marinum (strain ATCC 25205 / DSM 745 / LMG 13164 / NCIMB 1802) TaxID=880070 RepID=G0J308_CYCMS|nr:hypothetical protein Cycma_4618 [Cyclobacterium marinum DSM 745]
MEYVEPKPQTVNNINNLHTITQKVVLLYKKYIFNLNSVNNSVIIGNKLKNDIKIENKRVYDCSHKFNSFNYYFL